MKPLNPLARLGLAAAILVAGIASASAAPLKTIASFSVLADVVKQVGGEHVEVTPLVGPGGDPHEFAPTPDDARNLKAADVVFVSGFGLEGWLDRLISASGYQGTPVVASEGVPTRELQEDGETVTDPHVWNSPANVEIWVGNIEKALAAADPEDANAFAANAQSYLAKLKELDAYAHSKFDAVPQADRRILTSHDAFGYFGDAYGITFLAPVGVSTETEASAADVAALIDQIKAEGVKAYFFESSNDPRLVQQIANATGAEPGGELFVESLSDASGPAATYAGMFRHNVDLIAAALAK